MRYTAALAVLFMSSASSMADMILLGDLHIDRPMLRETPPNATVGAGYLTVVNTGDSDDTLTGAAFAADVAEDVHMHRMAMADGVMTMRAVEGGIPLPAGETVTLVSGGDHLMITGLERPLTAGESHEVTLAFEKAGEVTLDMPVMTLGEIRAASEGTAPMDHTAPASN